MAVVPALRNATLGPSSITTPFDDLLRGAKQRASRLPHRRLRRVAKPLRRVHGWRTIDAASAGASFGFRAITDIGAALEREAKSADPDVARRVILQRRVSELSTYLDGVGHGAEFTAPPPLFEPREVTIDARVSVAPLVAPLAVGARRIGLVEDSGDMRVVFREVLEHDGHHVTEARDGIEGLALILAEKPDVAIVDIGLPGMDGCDVARGVRAALGSSVLLVALTGYERESDRVKALAAGFDIHMTKPVDMVLVQRILGTTLPIAIPEDAIPSILPTPKTPMVN